MSCRVLSQQDQLPNRHKLTTPNTRKFGSRPGAQRSSIHQLIKSNCGRSKAQAYLQIKHLTAYGHNMMDQSFPFMTVSCVSMIILNCMMFPVEAAWTRLHPDFASLPKHIRRHVSKQLMHHFATAHIFPFSFPKWHFHSLTSSLVFLCTFQKDVNILVRLISGIFILGPLTYMAIQTLIDVQWWYDNRTFNSCVPLIFLLIGE